MSKKKAPIDGRWKILESLGEGGQSHTFLVRDLSDESVGWVLKRLKNRKRLNRFEREIQALQSIASNHIPTIHAYSTGETAYVVTRFLGRDLKSHERTAQLDIFEALDVFSQVVTAVSDAHGVGVAHRDIKPNNIVLSETSLDAYVIDFGICQYIDRQLTTLTRDEALGNAAFAAPECFLGSEQEPTSACDVYSLGKLLYWLCSRGGFINREELTEDHIDRIATDEPVERECIARIVRHCVRKDPTQRPSITALLEEVRAAQAIVARTRTATSEGFAVLVDRFGVDDSFNRSGFKSATTTPRHELAAAFVASTSVNLNSLTLALGGYTGRQQTAHVRVVSDANGRPDENDMLEGFTVMVGPQPQALSLQSKRKPLLRAGTRYWVTLSVSEPDSRVSWWTAPIEFMPQSDTFAERIEEEPWRVATSGGGPGHALRVVGRRVSQDGGQ